MDDLNNFDEQLALSVRNQPGEFIPVVITIFFPFNLNLVRKSSAIGL
jgi:hypothetical protein